MLIEYPASSPFIPDPGVGLFRNWGQKGRNKRVGILVPQNSWGFSQSISCSCRDWMNRQEDGKSLEEMKSAVNRYGNRVVE